MPGENKCITPCGDHSGNFTFHYIAGHYGLLSVRIKLVNINLTHAHPPGCGIGLVVTSKKCQFLLLHGHACVVSLLTKTPQCPYNT